MTDAFGNFVVGSKGPVISVPPPVRASSGVTSGSGSPVGVVDASKFVIYVQIDSVPPLLQWFSNGTAWTT